MAERKLKIALIDPVGGHGGMDYYDYGLAQGLGKNGVEVLYFTCAATKKREYPNVQTFSTFKKVWENTNKLVRLFYFLKGYYKAFKKAKRYQASVAHFQFFDLSALNLLVVLLAVPFRFKKIVTLHDVSSFKGDNKTAVEKFILDRFDFIIVHNEFSYRELSLKIQDEQKMAIVRHGNYLPFIEELPYSPAKDASLNLLFFGQIKKVKGLKVLLKALQQVVAQNPNVRLTIAGKPWHDQIGKYEQLIAELDLQDHVTTVFEFIDDKAMPDYFKNTDVVVLPYKKIYQSGVLLLSMSYGRVVLTSDLAAFKEVVKHEETGLLFETKNATDLAQKILWAAENKTALLGIRKNASHLLQTKFDWGQIGKNTLKIYSTC